MSLVTEKYNFNSNKLVKKHKLVAVQLGLYKNWIQKKNNKIKLRIIIK
jgi:hypothetical protein